ncbi:hypothetical protein [Microcystis phage Mwe-JY26]
MRGSSYALSYKYRLFRNPLLGLLAPVKWGGRLRYVPCESQEDQYFPGEQHREFTFWLGAEAFDVEG